MMGFNWIQIIGGAVAAFALSWLMHTVDVDRLEKVWAAKVEDQKAADTKQCNSDKQTTKEANDALQKDRDIIANRLSALKLRSPVQCIIPADNAKLLNTGPEHAGRNGEVTGSSDAFREYAGTCEGYRSEVMTCITFLGAERAR